MPPSTKCLLPSQGRGWWKCQRFPAVFQLPFTRFCIHFVAVNLWLFSRVLTKSVWQFLKDYFLMSVEEWEFGDACFAILLMSLPNFFSLSQELVDFIKGHITVISCVSTFQSDSSHNVIVISKIIRELKNFYSLVTSVWGFSPYVECT